MNHNEPNSRIKFIIYKVIHQQNYRRHFSLDSQREKSRGFCEESPGIVVVGGGNPRGNLGCKWNKNPHGNSGEILKSELKWEGSFPKPVNILIHQRMTSNCEWDIFTSLEPFLCHYVAFWNFSGKHRGDFHVEISPGIPQGKEAIYPHKNSPSFPPNFCGEIMRIFPQEWSPGIPP